MASEDDKRRFMEAACGLKGRDNRVMSSELMERTGWDIPMFSEVAKDLRDDGDVRLNEYTTSQGSPTGEVASLDFIWLTEVGLRRWCQNEAHPDPA
jgi:hypothetical protein